MIKKIIILISVISLLIPIFSYAQSEPSGDVGLSIYFFWAEGCPHCAKEEIFLDKIKKKYKDQIEIFDYEVSQNPQNVEILQKMGKKFDTDVSGVPFTVVEDKYFVGFDDEDTTGRAIETYIDHLLNARSGVIQEENNNEIQTEVASTTMVESVKIPFFGSINLKSFSLPVITIILGILDGFNPCAMWALLFLISLLLGMEDKKRMWILGSAFIIASATVYFLFMAAWLNLILFLGFVIWIRILIGLVALFSGGYNIREFFKNKEGACKVSGTENKKKIFEKLKQVTYKNKFWLALGGIILLACAVNLVELICSAGLPAVYSQILALNNLSTWQYYSYILLYIFFFMIDDLFVFFVAMITLQMTGVSGKYSRWSSLVGGILMLLIGLLLIFKHEWLLFG